MLREKTRRYFECVDLQTLRKRVNLSNRNDGLEDRSPTYPGYFGAENIRRGPRDRAL